MVRIQILSRGHSDEIWCFCYQYTILIVSCIFNMRLVTAPIVALYNHNNISYTIPCMDIFIWGCKIYIINYNQVKKPLDPCTNTYACACPPSVDPSLLHQSTDGLFVVYSNYTKVIISFDPNTRRIKRNFHFYIDEYDIKFYPKAYIYW